MLTLSPQPAPTWDDPIAMLYACHSNVRRFCSELQRLAHYLAENGCDTDARNSIARIRRYFGQAAPLHHDDEEQDFFPALLAHAPHAANTMTQLAKEHHALSALWAQVEAQFTKLENGSSHTFPIGLANDFANGYHRHMTLEEPLFDLGKQVLRPSVLAQMGKVMAARRQTS